MRDKLSEEALFERMRLAFSDSCIQEVRWRVSQAREAIAELVSGRVEASIEWREASELYRCWLFEGGQRRKTGARPMRQGEWEGLCALRDLRVDVIRPPG